jgi:hypothetical protein
MEEVLEQVKPLISNAQTLIKVRFIQLKAEDLPGWTDAHFESFVRDWLEKSVVDTDRLHKKDFSNSLQALINKSCIGENCDDILSVKLFSEFKNSVCLFLDFVQ